MGILETMIPLYHSKVKAPHCLMELSVKCYNRVKRNIIHVSGISILNGVQGDTQVPQQYWYSCVSYGKNINISKKPIDNRSIC